MSASCEVPQPIAAPENAVMAPETGAACALPGAVVAGAPERTWTAPGAQDRYEILRTAKSVAIVGASENPARASFFVATYLLGSSPYDVYFVNPRATSILGRPVYASLGDLPVVPDIVDVFRRHDDLPGVAQEAVDVGAAALWLQLGSWNDDAAAIAETAGLSVVMDRCIKIEHARFHGGLHLAGFDTGVISSKRQLRSR